MVGDPGGIQHWKSMLGHELAARLLQDTRHAVEREALVGLTIPPVQLREDVAIIFSGMRPSAGQVVGGPPRVEKVDTVDDPIVGDVDQGLVSRKPVDLAVDGVQPRGLGVLGCARFLRVMPARREILGVGNLSEQP
jgi:hypothetical protein